MDSAAPYRYKMLQLPPTVFLPKSRQKGTEAADYLEKIVNEMASKGREFYRVDPFAVAVPSGCLGGIFNAKHTFTTYHVVTFRQAM